MNEYCSIRSPSRLPLHSSESTPVSEPDQYRVDRSKPTRYVSERASFLLTASCIMHHASLSKNSLLRSQAVRGAISGCWGPPSRDLYRDDRRDASLRINKRRTTRVNRKSFERASLFFVLYPGVKGLFSIDRLTFRNSAVLFNRYTWLLS